MKPKVFIGSSTESLEIAYLIQENLEYDAQVTVWTQGIFKLSKSNLDSLIGSLAEFDFAIFVFQPDDIVQIRDNSYKAVRDNLIFELGLFIGRLGIEKVYFLIPRSIQNLHLPTDILGITPGTYDDIREDGNLQASLGPFCNQIRKTLKSFTVENIEDIKNEPSYIKKIVIDKPKGWEYKFAYELLTSRLKEIDKDYDEVLNDLVIQKKKTLNGYDFFDWFQNSLANFENYLNLFMVCLQDLNKSFGDPGVAGKPIEIKNAVNRIIQLCKALINWECELISFNVPNELEVVKTKLKGATKVMYIDELNKMHLLLGDLIKEIEAGNISGEKSLMLHLKTPAGFETIVSDFKRYFETI